MDAPTTSSKTQSAARLPRTVLAHSFTSFLTDIGSQMIFPLLPVFIASLGGAPTFIGLVEGVYGLTEPVERALIKELAPSRLQGRAYGYFNLVSGLCAIPAGVLTGYLWQELSPAWALRIGAGFAVCALALLLLWSRAPVLEPGA